MNMRNQWKGMEQGAYIEHYFFAKTKFAQIIINQTSFNPFTPTNLESIKCGSNFYVCGWKWNPSVWPFKWKLLSSTLQNEIQDFFTVFELNSTLKGLIKHLLNLPIIMGVPWVWKWCNKSRPLARISAPMFTNIIFDVTPRRCSRHMLTSKEPIHCRDPANSLPLSWRSTRACWISRWLGTGLDE